MKTKYKTRRATDYLITGVFIPMCIVCLLALHGLLLKWHLATLLMFWFVVVPLVILFLSAKFFKERNTLWRSLMSLVIFYSFMVFMIYKHYQSDFFLIMMVSFVWNALIMLSVIAVDRAKIMSKHRMQEL